MAFEWLLDTPVSRSFKTISKIVTTRMDLGVGEDGKPDLVPVNEETEVETEVEAPADRVRVRAAANDTVALQFHIRLLYGRLDESNEFEGAARDDGIIIGGPEYEALDTDEDGRISEDELLNMSASILGWDGELVELS
jgi:hypothetical protein